MRGRSKHTRRYRPKGWAHHLNRDLAERNHDSLQNRKADEGLAGADATTLFLADLQRNELPLLSRDAELELARRARNGDERALEQLVSSNLPLCVYLAKRSKSRGRRKGLAFGDLVGAGVIGLHDAIKHFDPERGVPLASFAYLDILGAIRD